MVRFSSPWRPGILVACGAVLVLTAWLGVRAYQVRSHLEHAKATLATFGSVSSVLDGTTTLDAAMRRAVADVDAARSASDDPIWRAAAAVPLAGRSFAMVRDLAHVSADMLDRVGPSTVRAAQLLAGRKLVDHGQVDLPLLGLLRPSVSAAAAGATAARQRLAGVSTRYVPGFLSGQRDALARQVGRLAAGLSSAATVMELAPPMLGRDGPRRYFVAVMNEAESRAAGGFVGAYAVLRAQDGRISRERVGTDIDFRDATAPVVDLGPEFARNYDAYYARTHWSALGVSPHWPYTSRVAAGLLAAQGGGIVDGVIGLDPLSMADILGATGPTTVDGRTIGAANVADFILRDEYRQFPTTEDPVRKGILGDLAGGVFQHVIDGATSPTLLVKALAHAGSSGHLLLYSAHANEEAALHGLAVAGELPEEPGAFLSLITQNAAGNKIDSYLRRQVVYSRPAPHRGLVVVTLTNLVPPGVPPIVTLRLDRPSTPPVYGETRLLVTVYCSVHAAVIDMTVNGKPAPFVPGTERGHGTGTLLVSVRPGHPTVLVAGVTDPGGSVTYREQPLSVPDRVTLPVVARS